MFNKELNKKLVNRFPNLKEKYKEEVEWQEGDDTGSHTVYGDVLTPYLIECILKDCRQNFQTIFDFLEELLELKDKYVDEVVCFSVLESVSYIFKEKPYLISYLGDKCRKVLNDII